MTFKNCAFHTLNLDCDLLINQGILYSKKIPIQDGLIFMIFQMTAKMILIMKITFLI